MIDRIEIENLGLFTYTMSRPTTEQEELLDRLNLKDLVSYDVMKRMRASFWEENYVYEKNSIVNYYSSLIYTSGKYGMN